ncbi:MAG TPA: helix-turn-helix domain-containing protein [Thermoanaerobaculia bacterium]|nr:helix-turn-helix domain-containing protein [Thermoanaerobaculia bacterium]
MAKRGDPKVLRLVVRFLRNRADLSQAEFGKACRGDQAQISRYEADEPVPEEVLRRMAAVARVEWWFVVALQRLYAAILASARRRGVANAEPLDLEILEPALLAVTAYLMEDDVARSLPQPVAEARREAEEVWAALERFPIPDRRRLLEFSLRPGRSVALAARACEASVRAAAHQVEEALELAELALFIAGQAPEDRRSRACSYCWGYIGNARRVATDFDAADEAFGRSWSLRPGAYSDPKLLPEWRLLDLEASLRREQRRFTEASTLLDRARAASSDDPAAAARILLKKERLLNVMNDFKGALATLVEAAPFVEASGDPHLRFALRFNRTDDLCHLERWAEAAKLLPRVTKMAAEQGNALDLIRLRWLQAKVAAGQGRAGEAIAKLEKVSGDFTERRLPYEAALSSLDLAVLWLQAGRNAEVALIAVGMKWIFEAKGIEREALAALRLFCDAAEREAATVELARRVIADLEKAERASPSQAKRQSVKG